MISLGAIEHSSNLSRTSLTGELQFLQKVKVLTLETKSSKDLIEFTIGIQDF